MKWGQQLPKEIFQVKRMRDDEKILSTWLPLVVSYVACHLRRWLASSMLLFMSNLGKRLVK